MKSNVIEIIFNCNFNLLYISKQDAVWGTLEPTIDEQLNAVEGLPQKIKDTAKDKFKGATVDPAVDKACDEALEKQKNEGNQ